ncbi:LLM class F420-dependent oxidoreductase [Amycolatopsis sp. NPDC005232]|uniref:LLM class F420-dependent oxidoreductase n=1 Tax=Amycolatopsis sp. NPDC005232 TaxID=3157027 RepID=UPI0033A92848
MLVGIYNEYSAKGSFRDLADDVVAYERAGADIAYVAEVYTFDAVSQLGALAALTSTIRIGSAILPIYTRTPSLIAMTAAGLDHVSEGRFILGLGASGPQVIEGFHGVPYTAPLGRTREVVEICRQVWRRERVVHQGKHYRIPLPEDEGTGLGKPLKLINTPVRSRIPILIASIGPKNVAMTAELADIWQPFFFLPEKAKDVWGQSLADGAGKRADDLPPLQIEAQAVFRITDDPRPMLDAMRPTLALYIGGMGAKGHNFYNDLVRRYGFEAEAEKIQDLYLAGKKQEAEAAVPEELLRSISLIGPESHVRERISAYQEAGVTTLTITPAGATRDERAGVVEQFRALVDKS